MLQEENEAHGPYVSSYQQGPFESVAVLENPTNTHAPAEQDTSPLPLIPQEKASLPPQNRQGRGGAILLFTLVLAIIFGVGLFAGLEYAGSNLSSTSSTATTSKAVVTTPNASSSGSTIEAQQEAAIAKIEPAVVELDVTTMQGEQIGHVLA